MVSTGLDLDSTYSVTAGSTSRQVAAGGLVNIDGVGGAHTIELGGVASNCTVTGQNPQRAQLEVGGIRRDTARVTFAITCVATTGVIEVAVVTIFFLFGHIYFGHFEERTPKWRKVLKYFATLIIILLISVYFGRSYSFALLGLALLPVIYIHGVVLPRNGINGWTGEPKGNYYEFRGLNKDIFGTDDKI